MARRNLVPSYLLHKQSGRGRAVWTDAVGQQRQSLLPGRYNSRESLEAFKQFQSKLDLLSTQAPDEVVTVNELMLAYVEHALTYYRRTDGTPTNEIALVKLVSKHTRGAFGDLPVDDFGPMTLIATRERFIALGWSRRTVNQQVDRLRRVFRWGTERELVKGGVYQALSAVPGLRRGRSEARETEPVKPVDAASVDATLLLLGRHVGAMVELQRVTGMRPGEVCRMRLADIDRTGSPWVYKPTRHKTQHLGKHRTVMIGPKGRAVIEAFIAAGTVVDPSGPLFSPRRMREERFAAMRAKRKTKVQPSQADRRAQNPDPRKLPAEQYTPNAYALAVRRAAKRARVPHWHPNQLRHAFGTLAREQHGLEAAQHLLGHSRSDVTERYARTAASIAAAAAVKIG